jgi:hypothetical protein
MRRDKGLNLNGQRTMLSQEPIFTIRATLDPVMSLGLTPLGERRIIGIHGGTVDGRKLKGSVLPGGADWQIVRADGAADIRARYTIESEAGGRVLVESIGLRHGPPDVLEKLMRGETVDPALYYFRTAMRFETGEPSLDWLNRILAVARGEREALAVKLDVYEVE